MIHDWTAGRLRRLRKIAARGYPHETIALSLDVSKAEVDLALWMLLGRTPEQASTLLNARKAA